jgi:hypothetical protein
VAPKLPERYQTHVRLGRDGDVEEWLATDRSLDRPVLVRILDTNAASERRAEFVGAVRAAAAAHHVHLVEVYAVGDESTPYAVAEWHGGVTIADRLNARQPLPVDDFLPNATGIASGLAALHAVGAVHGGIDPSAIGYSTGRNAKLGSYGRSGATAATAEEDTKALAAALRVSISGERGDSVGPSQIAEGIPPAVDEVLAAAEAGELNAARLATSLRSIPPATTPRGARWSWGWLGLVAALLLAGVVISAVGIAMDFDEDSPVLFPAAPQPDPETATTNTRSTTTSAPAPDRVPALAVVYDPFGDDVERDADIGLLSDGNAATGWRTERYFRILSEIKPGVGVVFATAAEPTGVIVQGTPGTSYEWKWAGDLPEQFTEWEHIGRGVLLAGQNSLQLPPRPEGRWLLWLTDLPADGDGEYIAELTVVRFVQ